MNRKRNILVTGGAGYIGSHTVVELVEAGFNPIIVDDFRNSTPTVDENLEILCERKIQLYPIDVLNVKELEAVFQDNNIEGIIHFAAYKAVGESVQNPLTYYQNNIGGLTAVLQLAEKYGVYNFVFSSSCTVYGEPGEIKEVNEDTETKAATSPYGTTKIIGEQILHDLFKSNMDFKILNLRYFNPIGAHKSGLIGELPLGKPNNLLPFITQTAIGIQKTLKVFGNDYPTSDGTCVRDFIHVVDLAKAHVKGLEFLLNQQHGRIEAVNIGTGKGVSVKQLIDTFESTNGVKVTWEYAERRPGDVVEIFANADKARTLLSWESSLTLEDAVRDAWNWEKNIRKND